MRSHFTTFHNIHNIWLECVSDVKSVSVALTEPASFFLLFVSTCITFSVAPRSDCRVAHHNGHQPMPHLGSLQRKNKQFRRFLVFSFSGKTNPMMCSVMLTNRSPERSSVHNCKHGKAKEGWCRRCEVGTGETEQTLFSFHFLPFFKAFCLFIILSVDNTSSTITSHRSLRSASYNWSWIDV